MSTCNNAHIIINSSGDQLSDTNFGSRWTIQLPRLSLLYTTCRSPDWSNSYKIGYSIHQRGHRHTYICCKALGCGRPVVAGTRITGHCPNPRYYWIGCSDSSIIAIMPWTNGPWRRPAIRCRSHGQTTYATWYHS